MEVPVHAGPNKIDLSGFNGPTDKLVVFLRKKFHGNEYFVYNSINSLRLIFGGVERMVRERKVDYFEKVQPYYHAKGAFYGNNMYLYSFAIQPDSGQPNGAYNLGRVMKKELIVDTDTSGMLFIIGNVYNVMKCHKGHVQFPFQ